MADERPQLPDFYAVLGVGFDATETELRSAWRTAVKKWHPDRNPSPEAHSMMAQINEAWEVLGNPERRAEYDAVYFQHRSSMAEEERRRRESERLERERQRREAEETRRRRMEEEQRRADSDRQERASQRQQRARDEPKPGPNGSNRRGAGNTVSSPIAPIFWSAVILVLIVIGVVIFSNSSGVINESDSAATRMAALTVEPSNPTPSVGRTRREYRNNSEPWRSTTAPTTVSVTATPTLTTAPTPGLVATVPPSPRVLVLPSPLPTATVRPTLTSEPTPTVAPSPTMVQNELNPLLTEALWTELTRRDFSPDPAKVEYFVDLGADVNSTDSEGRTMFEYAVLMDYASDVIEALSADVPSESATVALWFALYRTDYTVRPTRPPKRGDVAYLIGLGADVSVPDSFGRTMFEYAVGRGYALTMLQLLSAGLSAEAATNALWSSLYRDSMTGPPRDEVVYLISLGADVRMLDSRGRSMFEYAVGQSYDVEVLELLEASLQAPSPVPTMASSSTAQTSPEKELRGSGTLYSENSVGTIGCTDRPTEPGYLAFEATSGNVEFSFEMPSASYWSIGLLYHRGGSSTHSATYVFGSVRTGVGVGHWTLVDGLDVDSVEPVSVPLTMYDGTVGALNDVAIRTDADGTSLELNRTLVLHVPASELRPRSGEMQVCAGLLSDEWEGYGIDYIDLRAWTE